MLKIDSDYHQQSERDNLNNLKTPSNLNNDLWNIVSSNYKASTWVNKNETMETQSLEFITETIDAKVQSTNNNITNSKHKKINSWVIPSKSKLKKKKKEVPIFSQLKFSSFNSSDINTTEIWSKYTCHIIWLENMLFMLINNKNTKIRL